MPKINCAVCNVEFLLAPSRLTNNKTHTCSKKCASSIARARNAIYKVCEVCGVEFKVKKRILKDRAYKVCSSACRSTFYSITRTGKNNPNSSKLTDFQKFLNDRATSCNRRGIAKGLESNLTYLDLQEIYEQQFGRCFYSNVILSLEGKEDPTYISVDRINPQKGYTKDNVVLCSIACNFLKSNYTFNSLFNILEGLFTTMNKQVVKYKLVDESAVLPKQVHSTDAGFDLTINSVKPIPGGYICGTGISVQPPSGFHFEMVCRSSTYKKGLMLWNSIGIIDNEYTGEIKAVFKSDEVHVAPQVGDRLVQLILRPTINLEFIEVASLSETDRGFGGFGSTGNGSLGYGKL